MAWTPETLKALAMQEAAKHGLDPAMFVAQLAQESGNFAPDVVAGKRKSSAGAIGVAQFMPKTAASFKIDPTDPAQAIPAAARYMAQLTQQFGSEALARQAYNWGQGNLAKHLRNPTKHPLPKETAEYNTRVAARAGKQGDMEIPVLGQTPRTRVLEMLASNAGAPLPPAAAAGSAGLFSAPAPAAPSAQPGRKQASAEPQAMFAATEQPDMTSGLGDILARAHEATAPLFPKPQEFPDRFDGMIRQLLRSV